MDDDNGDATMLRYDTPHGNAGSQRLVLACLVFAIVISCVALIVAVAGFNRNPSCTTNVSVDGQGAKSAEDHIWTIAIGHWANNNVYIDEPSGQLRGFYVDMINAVCRHGNKDCRIIYDSWHRCWETKWDTPKQRSGMGGEGLLGGWYDACAGYIETHQRLRTFQFTDKWQNSPELYFVIKDGTEFNPKDVTGKHFGFVDGFYNDEHCLARQPGIEGATLGSSQIHIYQTQDEVLDALVSGEIDATIAQKSYWLELPASLKYITNVVIVCTANNGGAGLMLRKDNPLADWWNPAQKKLMQSEEYWNICQDIKDEHGHMPGRDPAAVCIGFK